MGDLKESDGSDAVLSSLYFRSSSAAYKFSIIQSSSFSGNPKGILPEVVPIETALNMTNIRSPDCSSTSYPTKANPIPTQGGFYGVIVCRHVRRTAHRSARFRQGAYTIFGYTFHIQ